jgi:hypothetical protein
MVAKFFGISSAYFMVTAQFLTKVVFYALFFLGFVKKNQYLKNLKLFLKKLYHYLISLNKFVTIISKIVLKRI